jgi:hypothetical protein
MSPQKMFPSKHNELAVICGRAGLLVLAGQDDASREQSILSQTSTLKVARLSPQSKKRPRKTESESVTFQCLRKSFHSCCF